jgi:hypothetical protein
MKNKPQTKGDLPNGWFAKILIAFGVMWAIEHLPNC